MGINEYLESRDISSSDVAPFLCIHTVLSAALVCSTWWFCYCGSGPGPKTSASAQLFQNGQMPQSVLLKSLISMPMIPDGIKARASRAMLSLENASRNSKPVKYLEQKMPSLDATRLCVSFAEAKFGRLFFKPITVPARIWLSWKGTKKWKQISSSISISSRCHSGCDDDDDVNNKKVSTAFLKGRGGVFSRDLYARVDSTIIKPKCNGIFLRECRGVTLA